MRGFSALVCEQSPNDVPNACWPVQKPATEPQELGRHLMSMHPETQAVRIAGPGPLIHRSA